MMKILKEVLEVINEVIEKDKDIVYIEFVILFMELEFARHPRQLKEARIQSIIAEYGYSPEEHYVAEIVETVNNYKALYEYFITLRRNK